MAKHDTLTQAEIDEICLIYDECRNQKETAKRTKHSTATVSKYLIANGRGCGQGGNQHYVITDEQILQGIADGLTRQEIADKYGTHVENLARRMKKLNVHARYENRRSCFGECWHYVESHDQKVKLLNPSFIYIESRWLKDSRSYKFRLKCRECGCVLERWRSSRQGNVTCEVCDKKKRNQQKILDKKRAELVRIFIALRELKFPKICECCGKEFYSLYAESLYCSEKCKTKAKKLRWKARYPQKAKEIHRLSKYKERTKKYGGIYESGITRIKVVERDNFICQICGKICNPEDNRWGSFGPDYPTLDHIVPLSKGGSHTWDNVQCACGMCNSIKSDSLELREEESA